MRPTAPRGARPPTRLAPLNSHSVPCRAAIPQHGANACARAPRRRAEYLLRQLLALAATAFPPFAALLLLQRLRPCGARQLLAAAAAPRCGSRAIGRRGGLLHNAAVPQYHGVGGWRTEAVRTALHTRREGLRRARLVLAEPRTGPPAGLLQQGPSLAGGRRRAGRGRVAGGGALGGPAACGATAWVPHVFRRRHRHSATATPAVIKVKCLTLDEAPAWRAGQTAA
jgi:hypothetical protein